MGRHASISPAGALVLAWAVLGGWCVPEATGWAPGAPYTTQFALEQCTFVASGRNRHFSIQPGHRLFLEGGDGGELVQARR